MICSEDRLHYNEDLLDYNEEQLDYNEDQLDYNEDQLAYEISIINTLRLKSVFDRLLYFQCQQSLTQFQRRSLP